MSQSFKLFRLQQLDTHLDQGRARLREIETALSNDSAVQAAQKSVQQASAELETARKALRAAEDLVRAQRIKIEQTEATLYGGKVRNTKELQDLQHESAALKRYLATLEDRQLDAMIAFEEAEGLQKTAAAGLESASTQWHTQNALLIAEKQNLSAEVQRLESERSAAAAAIPESELKLYETLRTQRRGVAVAKVSDKTCAACGSTLNAALLHAARLPSQLTRCDVCGRILYAG
ncbi:MAG: hypothetical protein L0Z70_12535 [Chloroflexi bacterium]|nr:hypothetical protein [Chloroflexota bacterium]